MVTNSNSLPTQSHRVKYLNYPRSSFFFFFCPFWRNHFNINSLSKYCSPRNTCNDASRRRCCTWLEHDQHDKLRINFWTASAIDDRKSDWWCMKWDKAKTKARLCQQETPCVIFVLSVYSCYPSGKCVGLRNVSSLLWKLDDDLP